MVETRRFELLTSCAQGKRTSQAVLRLDKMADSVGIEPTFFGLEAIVIAIIRTVYKILTYSILGSIGSRQIKNTLLCPFGEPT